MGVEWIVLGGIGAAANAINNYKGNKRLSDCEGHANYLMLDQEIERKLQDDIMNPSKFDEIWDRIERFKLRNPHIVAMDSTNYWDIVGKQRLSPVSSEGRRKTLCLLAMTYGRPCREQAIDISYQRNFNYSNNRPESLLR